MAVTSSKISKTGEHILTASMPVGITCRKNELQAEVDEIIDRSEERKMSMKKIVNPLRMQYIHQQKCSGLCENRI